MVQVITWLGTFVVASILTQEDYGIAAMAMVYISFVQLINEFGLSAAIVQRRDLTESQIARLGGLSLLLGVGFTVLSLIVAQPVAAGFKAEEVRLVIMVLSVTFVTSAFQVLPRSLLTRDLQFGKLAMLEASESLVVMSLSVVLALQGYGYWSLVIGGVAGRLVTTIAALWMRGHRIAWPSDFGSIAPLVRFGSHIVASGIAWYAFRNADLIIIGRLLGKAPLGAYGLASTFASIPVDRIAGVLTRATPAVFAKVQNDAAALRRYLLLVTEGISLVAFPAAVGLALVADDIIAVINAAEWAPAVGPLRVLALAAALRSLTPILNQVLIAKGESARSLKGTLVAALVLPPFFYIAAHHGITAVAFVWLVGHPLVVGVTFLRNVLQTTTLPLAHYLRALRPAALATIMMALAVLAASVWLDDVPSTRAEGIYRLAARCGIGVAAYVCGLAVVHGGRLRDVAGRARALFA